MVHHTTETNTNIFFLSACLIESFPIGPERKHKVDFFALFIRPVGNVDRYIDRYIGRHSIDIAVASRSTVDRLAIDRRSTLDRLSVARWSTVDRLSTDSPLTVDRTVDIAVDAPRPNIGHMSVVYRSTVGDMSSVDRVSTATSTDIAVDITYSKHDPTTQSVSLMDTQAIGKANNTFFFNLKVLQLNKLYVVNIACRRESHVII